MCKNDLYFINPDTAAIQVPYSTDGINSNTVKQQHTFEMKCKVKIPNMNLLTTKTTISLQDWTINSSPWLNSRTTILNFKYILQGAKQIIISSQI